MYTYVYLYSHFFMIKRLSIILGILWLGTVVHALVFEFPWITTTSISNSYTDISFVAAGNNFAWGIFWLPQKVLDTPISIVYGTETIVCREQIRGLYHNSQRWQRLWPLDGDTLAALQVSDASYNNLTVQWWWYTNCTWSNIDVYSIFGQIGYISYDISSYLLAGVHMPWLAALDTNGYALGLRNSLQYLNNELPLWYLYDTVGGIAFVGGQLTNHASTLISLSAGSSIRDIFFYEDWTITLGSGWDVVATTSGHTIVRQDIGIVGLLWLGSDTLDTNRQHLVGSQQDYTTVFVTNLLGLSDVINDVRARSLSICRWSSLLYTSFCYIFDTYLYAPIIVDVGDPFYQNKPIIVRNRDLVLQGSQTIGDNPLQVFVDNGNVYIDVHTGDLQFVDGSWNLTSGSGVTQGIFLQWYFVINGLLLAWSGSPETLDHKVYIRGKLFSLNSIYPASTGSIEFVQTLFPIDYSSWISFGQTFVWSCNILTGLGSDGVLCAENQDQFALYPLIIIDDIYSFSQSLF